MRRIAFFGFRIGMLLVMFGGVFRSFGLFPTALLWLGVILVVFGILVGIAETTQQN